MKKVSAFTLIELLIVMAVIAILIGIAIPSFRGMQIEARQTRAQGDTRTLKVAAEAYYKDHNNIYSTANTSGTQTWEAALVAAVPQILPAVIYDPFGATSTTQYSFKTDTGATSTARYYVIYSVGPSGAGSVSVATNGTVTVSGDAIWATNGYYP